MIIQQMFYYVIPFMSLLGVACGIISSYAVVRRVSFLGDIMSHSAFPGIAFVFLISPSAPTIFLLTGGFVASVMSAFVAFFLTKFTSVPRDTVLSLVLATFFSLGLIMLGVIQKKQISGQGIINNFLFGSLFTITQSEALWCSMVCILISFLGLVMLRVQHLLAFDLEYAKITLSHCFMGEFVLLLLTIITIIIGLKTIGIILIGALIITPGAIGKMLGSSYYAMVLYAIFFGIFSCVGGILFNCIYPHLPTGPIIVLFATGSCILIATGKKVYLRYRKNRLL